MIPILKRRIIDETTETTGTETIDGTGTGTDEMVAGMMITMMKIVIASQLPTGWRISLERTLNVFFKPTPTKMSAAMLKIAANKLEDNSMINKDDASFVIASTTHAMNGVIVPSS